MANQVANPVATMNFKIGEFGWSETHWYTSEVAINDPDLLTAAAKLAMLRTRMLAYGVQLKEIRLSLGNVWRDSLFATVPTLSLGPNGTGTVPAGVLYYNAGSNSSDTRGPADDPSSVSVWRMETNSLHRGIEYISGFPAGAQTEPMTYPWNGTPFAWLKGASDAYFRYLANLTATGNRSTSGISQWGTLVRLKAGEAGAPAPQNIISVSILAGVMTFTLAVPPTFAAGAAVRILNVLINPTGAKGRINGTWNVATVGVPNANSFTVLNGAISTNVLPLGGTGNVQAITLKVQPWNYATYDGQTHHKRGRPSDSPRGRVKRSVRTAVV